ncbi:ABC-F type ribosomal protection protein CplR [Clostridium sp.]|uniref:ABC-F type ribosomal protection protein CplR n=1 Tax=Clostridium sp. TaxID=1506 RepID=UPI003216C25D
MLLAKLNKIKKYYGDRLILDIDKLEILYGDRIGLVGGNGSGKSTLIKVLIGEVEISEGQIFIEDSYTYISQREDYIGSCEDGAVKSLFKAPQEYEEFLSGGEKVKLKVAKALSDNSRLIIADEPTSNLDGGSIKTLTDMLKTYDGALLLVSHDRGFLDELCNVIVEIEDGKLKFYNGNYSKYVELKKEEIKRQETEYFDYTREKKRLQGAILEKQGLRDGIRKAPKRMGNSEARLHKMGDQKGKKNMDANIKALRSRIEHLQVKEKPKALRGTKIRVSEGREIISKNVIQVKELTLVAGDKNLLQNVSFKIKRGKRVALIGENGCGKSTLLKAIINDHDESIQISNRVVIGYFDQDQNILKEDKTILDNVKEDSHYDESFIRINLDGFGFKGDQIYKKVQLLSGGERVKVALCKILLGDNNVLILDEPTNYLDIKSMEALEGALIGSDKTAIIVSHDKRFVTNVCDYIIEIENKSIRVFNGGYVDYIKEKHKPVDNKKNREDKERLMVLENRSSHLISLISLECDEKKKQEKIEEYMELMKAIKRLKI